MGAIRYVNLFIFSILILVACLETINGNPSRAHNLLRSRREAETPTGPSTTQATTTASVHASHNVKCDGDSVELAKSCPDKDTCPSDNDTMEKCCHCLNVCCNSPTSLESNGNGNMSGSDVGSKVKDAISSAEGWLKNAGQSIKNGWDKAKESVKQTAEDVKEKVKKGVNSVAERVKNATKGGECADGQCTTDMSSDSSTQENNSTENSSTPTPGYQKSKRDIYSSRVVRQPILYETMITSEDDSDSSEISQTKTTITTTGTKADTTRRYRRQSQQSQNGTMSAQTNSTSAGNDDTKRNKRAAKDCNSTRTNRKKRAYANDASAATLPTIAVPSKVGDMNTPKDRVRRGASNSDNGTTENSQAPGSTSMPSTTGSSNNRNRRQVTESTSTLAPGMAWASTTSASMGTETNGPVNSSGSKASDNFDSRNGSTISYSLQVLDSKDKGTNNGSTYIIDDNRNAASNQSKAIHLPILLPTQASSDAFRNVTRVQGNSPIVAYPDGSGAGIIASPPLPASNDNRKVIADECGNKETASTNFTSEKLRNEKMKMGSMMYYFILATTPRTVMLTPSYIEGSQLMDSPDKFHTHRDIEISNLPGENGNINSNLEDGNSENNISSYAKPGECQPLAIGLNCIPLSPTWAQCALDSDCLGSKKCCFYACDPYRHVGICEDAIDTPSKPLI